MSKDKPLQFRYRYSHNTLEEWKVVDLKRKTKGRPPDMGRILPTELHSHPRPIRAAKNDLMDLLEFVPPVHHAFYQDLLGGGGTEDSEDEGEHEHSESENSEQSDQDND